VFNKIEEEILDKLLTDLENGRLTLPTLPEVALRVRETLENENAGMGQVSKVITTDAALSARLIQVANSPLLRASRTIDSVEAAITRMGATMTRNLVTSIAMQQMFQATTDVTDTLLRDIWEHSIQVAAISHALCKQFTKLKPDEALLAGLVHDIGALPIISRAEDSPELLADLTLLQHIIEKAHPMIGEAILKKWNFSPELIMVAAEHENLQRSHAGNADYTDLVMVANLESHAGSKRAHAQIDYKTVPAFSKLGLDPDVNVVAVAGETIEAAKMAFA
jgi:putative nucleotidyltransferase with HDIG domain